MYLFRLLLASPCDVLDLHSQTRDGTHALWKRRVLTTGPPVLKSLANHFRLQNVNVNVGYGMLNIVRRIRMSVYKGWGFAGGAGLYLLPFITLL